MNSVHWNGGSQSRRSKPGQVMPEAIPTPVYTPIPNSRLNIVKIPHPDLRFSEIPLSLLSRSPVIFSSKSLVLFTKCMPSRFPVKGSPLLLRRSLCLYHRGAFVTEVLVYLDCSHRLLQSSGPGDEFCCTISETISFQNSQN